MSKSVLLLDSQILNSFESCHCKFYYNFIVNVRPMYVEAFDKGSLIHQILKFHYKLVKHNQMNRGRKLSYEEIVKISIHKGIKYLLKLDLPAEIGAEVIAAYENYAAYYQNCNWQVLEVEQPFARTLYEDESIKVIYCGIIDLLTSTAIVDHKSSSRRGTPATLDNQFLGYCWALDVNNLVVNKIGFQKTLKAEERFERHVKSYSKELLDEWRENTIRAAVELYNNMKDVSELAKQKNYTSCGKPDQVNNSFFGCIYQKICESHPTVRDFIISKDYRIGEQWNPIKRLEK